MGELAQPVRPPRFDTHPPQRDWWALLATGLLDQLCLPFRSCVTLSIFREVAAPIAPERAFRLVGTNNAVDAIRRHIGWQVNSAGNNCDEVTTTRVAALEKRRPSHLKWIHIDRPLS